MFGVDTTELLLIAVAALIFIGPKDLPQALRTVGRWVGKVRGMASHFHSGIEAIVREAELEEMERKWREENERIMREFPAIGADQVTEAQAYLASGAEPGSAVAPAQPPLDNDHHLPPEQRELP
jgi:sec-independent protein translocase protein TatB